MKKYFKILVLFIAVVIMTGCGANKAESKLVRTCTLKTNDVINGYSLEAEYSIYATGSSVDKVVTTETVSSDNEELLTQVGESLKQTYSTMNDNYGGYTNEVTNTSGKLVSKTTIDYNVMNLKKFVEDNTTMKNYVNSNNKFTVNGITQLYNAMGATCK